MTSIVRLTRLGSELDELRAIRAELVATVRDLAGRYADPNVKRIFAKEDFDS
jgi:hypothetical protein